jgi:hypothetical protein
MDDDDDDLFGPLSSKTKRKRVLESSDEELTPLGKGHKKYTFEDMLAEKDIEKSTEEKIKEALEEYATTSKKSTHQSPDKVPEFHRV